MTHQFMREALQKIATGPTLSKDLSRNDACQVMRFILEGKADPVQAGIFLIALRMKRETDDELAGVLDAINGGIETVPVAVDQLTTIVDPYDGFLRSTPAGPFLAPVLAACGLRVLTHGVYSMGPKFGASHEMVLQAAGASMPANKHAAVRQIEDPEIAWAYLSQAELAPELASLTELRTRIVKRPCLTTVEVAVNALVPEKESHLVTGYVHKPYPPIYAKLANVAGFSSSTLIRGTEGGVIPSLTQSARFFHSTDGSSLAQTDLEPTFVAIDRQERAVPLPAELSNDGVRSVKEPDNPFAAALAQHAACCGLDALKGGYGYTRDALIYGGSVILHAQNAAKNLQDAARQVEAVLDDGSALARLCL
ncbi:MAG: anthranilate phosphoribosyltransferase [Granulosicoccus sp.]|nr:anthranilate phosphoribosyltransferase [Granulosicoccus sp.]